MNITEKTAYLKGLMDGINLDESKPENKLIKAVVETLDAMSAEIAELTKETEHLEDFMDDIDYDLGELEADYYEAWDDEDEDEAYCVCDDCDAEDCSSCELFNDEDEADDKIDG